MNCGTARSVRWIGLFILLLLSVGHPRQSFAQAQKGSISGTVTDQAGAVLKGAQISIVSQDIHVVSDEQGMFVITGLNPGSCSLAISYVGFTDLQQTVNVSAGQNANVSAQLQLKSQSESILVSAPRVTGEAEAVNIERAADNLVQVLPEEVIQSLPNANMADALGRLPSVTLERDEGEGKYVQVRGTEPRLTNTTIDGVDVPSPEPGVRQIKFDAIPADLVESVQVSKTLQANMEGDGIGGSVNLITKTATNTPTISIDSIGGYTPIIHGRGETAEGGTIGERFGPNKRFGVLIGGSYDWNGRAIDDIEPVPDVATLAGGQQVSWKDGMDVREYQYFRSRWGLAGSANYKISEASNIYVRAFFSDFHNYGDRWDYSLVDNTPGIQLLNPGNEGCATDSTGTTTSDCSGTPSFNTQLRNPAIGIGNLMVGGVHDLTTTWFAWDVAVSRGFYGNSSSSTAEFGNTLASSSCQYDPANTSNQFLPRWSGQCYNEAYNPSNFVLNDINRNLGTSAQVNIEASGSGAKRYHIGSRLATIEVGGRFRNAHKFSDGYTLTLTPDGTIPLTTFPNRLTNSNYYNGGEYPLGYNANYEDAIAYANANPTLFTSSSTQGQDPQEFDLVEKVGAGYLMNIIDLSSRFRLVAGVRVEATNDNISNFSVGSFPCPPPETGTCNSLDPNRFSGSYITVEPSASLKYAVSNNDNLRFIYARALSRPDPQDLAQALMWTDAGNGANRYSVSFGNPNLVAETGDDVDVLYDHYFNTFGMFSAGYFYKFLHNPIVQQQFQLVNYQPPGGPLGNYLANEPVNAGTAWVSGFELAYLQHFSGLPGAWAGLGLSANYGYTSSRANDIPGRSDHPTLLRTSPNAFNISPTYDRGRVSIRVGLSYNQASLYAYQYADGTPGGVNGPLSDVYFYTHFQVDAEGSLRLNHGLTLIVSGLNLNNEVFGFYQGSPQYMIQREYYQPTFSAGLRWEAGR